MEKVKVTREQGIAIKKAMNTFENKAAVVEHHFNYGWKGGDYLALNRLNYDDLIRAVYIGYEVEPEFKVKDWVVYESRLHNEPILTRIANINRNGIILEVENIIANKDRIRLATPSEIAEEKERRWWRKHGREVWELKSGDILRRREGKMVEYVAKAQGEEVWFEYRGSPDTLDYVRKNCYVACFAENRMDREGVD